MSLVGYIRVSDKDQNLARQLEAMEKVGVDKLFQESVSGKNEKDRLEFNKMMDYLREDDTLVIKSIDRFGRNYDDIKRSIQDVKDKGVKLHSIDEEYLNFDTGDEAMDKMMFDQVINLLAFVAQNEREKIKERQSEGIALAKKRGVYKDNGAVKKYSPTGTEKEKYFAIVEDLKQNRPIAQIAKDRGVSRPTIYNIKDELAEQVEAQENL